MALVEIAGPVVGGTLGAHVVACSVGCLSANNERGLAESKGVKLRSTIPLPKRIHHAV